MCIRRRTARYETNALSPGQGSPAETKCPAQHDLDMRYGGESDNTRTESATGHPQQPTPTAAHPQSLAQSAPPPPDTDELGQMSVNDAGHPIEHVSIAQGAGSSQTQSRESESTSNSVHRDPCPPDDRQDQHSVASEHTGGPDCGCPTDDCTGRASAMPQPEMTQVSPEADRLGQSESRTFPTLATGNGEILGPWQRSLILTLIAFVDRQHDTQRRLRREIRRHGRIGHHALVKELRNVSAGVEAAIFDAETTLTAIGVRPQVNPQSEFDSSTQDCVGVVAADGALVGHIAERLRNGYRFRDAFVRRELVTVYAAASDLAKGELSDAVD